MQALNFTIFNCCKNIFLFLNKTYAVGTQNTCLIETVKKTKFKTDRKENIHNFRLIFLLSGPLMELENFISIKVHLSGAPFAKSAAFYLVKAKSIFRERNATFLGTP